MARRQKVNVVELKAGEGVKQFKGNVEGNHLWDFLPWPEYGAEVTNAQNRTSTPPYVFMVLCLNKHNDKLNISSILM
jgi:hypothetical protein